MTPSNIEDTVKTTGVGNRQNILILDNNGNWSGQYNANNKISEDGGAIIYPVGKTESTVAIGDIVTIGTEDFYVFENNNSELKLLARYNLKVGKDYDDTGHVIHEHTSSEEGYGIQSADMYGLKSASMNEQSEVSNIRTGAVMFSTTNYWVGQTGEGQKYSSRYVYDSNSTIYPYLENYKTYLERFGVNPEVKLLNEDDLGTVIDTKYGFLFTTTFWSGSSISRNGSEYIGIFYYSSNYNTGMASPQSFASFGVRPLVIIQK